MGVGVNRQVYTRRFLNTMKPKALQKWYQFPGLFDKQSMLAAQDLYQFDEAFTAPLHGFSGALGYWSQCSSQPHLNCIQLPTLVINARNDPFVPEASLPMQKEVGEYVKLWKPKEGGHVGFASGAYPGMLDALPRNVMGWYDRSV